MQVNKCRWSVCVCAYCFCPPSFFPPLPVYVFHFQPPSSSLHLRHPLQCLFSLPPTLSLSLTPLSSGSAGVHMIKHGTQVITWRCQIKRPLIQMRSEISKSSVALAATTHPRRRRRGDLRARGPAGRQQQHSAFPRYKISPVESTEPNMPGFTRAYLFVSHSLLVR